MSSKVLSIVVPAYNEEAFLGSLLEKINRVPLEESRVCQRNCGRRRWVGGSDVRGGLPF